MRLIVFGREGAKSRTEYRLENGSVVPRIVPIQPDEWGVHLPFDIGHDGERGELAIFRRYGRSPLLTDVNLIVETLRPSLGKAAGRVAAPVLP